MSQLSIGNLTLEPGQSYRGELGSVQLSDGTRVRIPLMAVRGDRDGPVLWLGAAMHGQELSGIGVLWELFNQLLDPRTLRGTVVGSPLLNPLSFTGGTYFTPQDGYNINRVFPGDDRGLLTARMARLVYQEAVQKADVVLDFHANPEPALYFSIIKEPEDGQLWARCRELAEAFGITSIEMRLELEAHRTGTIIDAALELGKPCLAIELVGWRRLVPESVAVGVRGTLNVMKRLGMIDGRPEPQEGILVLGTRLTRTELTSEAGGLVRLFKEPGDRVGQGEVVGQIVSVYGEGIRNIESPVDGWLLAFPFLGNQAVGTGDILAFFAFGREGS